VAWRRVRGGADPVILGKVSDATAHHVNVGAGLDEDGVGTTSADLGENTVEIGGLYAAKDANSLTAKASRAAARARRL